MRAIIFLSVFLFGCSSQVKNLRALSDSKNIASTEHTVERILFNAEQAARQGHRSTVYKCADCDLNTVAREIRRIDRRFKIDSNDSQIVVRW